MRDPNRIDGVLALLAVEWKKYPDMRLGQLLVSSMIIHGKSAGDLRGVEDAELVTMVQELLRACETQ